MIFLSLLSPDFYNISSKYVLKVSDMTTRKDWITLGTYDETNQKFIPTASR